MSSQSFRIGVAGVTISQPSTTLLPSLSSLVFTASAAAPTTSLALDIKNKLATTTTYQVMLGLMGQDNVNGGYTITPCSPGSGVITLTSGQGISITVPNANWPANFATAAGVAVFLKTGTGNWTLAEFAYLPTGTDFNHMITCAPLGAAPSFTAAILQSATEDSGNILGNRAPTGYTFVALGPTTKGVTVKRQVSSVTVSPDNSADFNITTTRTAEISFQLLPNDIVYVVEGNAGSFVQYTGTNGVVSEAQMSIFTASAIIPGNAPMFLYMPLSSTGAQEIRLYLGQLLRNQSENNEAWTKTDTTPITYTYSAASIDTLLNAQASEIIYRVG